MKSKYCLSVPRLTLCAVLLGAFVPFARATSAAPPAGPGTELHVQVGLAASSPHRDGPAAGGTVLLQPGRRVAFEGAATYLGRGQDAWALSLSSSLILDLLPPEEKTVPYLVGGGGVLRASFDTRSPRFSGAGPSGEMGTGRYEHVMDAPPRGWDLGELPAFYADRVEASIARDGGRGRATFTDPALTLGAGVKLRLGRGWMVGPDARALLAFRSGRVYTLWLASIRLGWGF
jgi:hypothetical protein